MNNLIVYCEIEDGVVADVSFVKTEIVQNQMVGVLNYQPSYLAGKGLTYYSGGGWNKGGFESLDDWNNYISGFAQRVRQPLIVSVQ